MLRVHEISGCRKALSLLALVESPVKSLSNIISCREYITAAVDLTIRALNYAVYAYLVELPPESNFGTINDNVNVQKA